MSGRYIGINLRELSTVSSLLHHFLFLFSARARQKMTADGRTDGWVAASGRCGSSSSFSIQQRRVAKSSAVHAEGFDWENEFIVGIGDHAV